MKELERRDYFPTMIFQGDVQGDERLNSDVVKAVIAARDKDEQAGVAAGGRQGHWRSAKSLQRKAEFRPLKDQIQAALDLLSAELKYSKDHALKIAAMWSNILSPGHGTPAECRPGNLWTGCYCAQVPKGTGSLKFIDPRTINIMNPPKYEKGNKLRACLTKVEFKPSVGRLAIFPAWLYHEVEPNLSKENGRAGDFIFISFNVTQGKR